MVQSSMRGASAADHAADAADAAPHDAHAADAHHAVGSDVPAWESSRP